MPRLALYREERPRSFAEVVGQPHITRTLKNALVAQRLSHAYLFAGPRGTGKTSVARILAKAVNCHALQGGEPCDACTACTAIIEGRSLDIIEIDAASNRGIDEIRDLRDKVKYAPVDLKCKVYIIDEVHMLTEPAFNALLKTLEEPPAHAMFVLATTEPHKVPVTIRSRCQRHDFHRLALGEMVERLQEVCRRHAFNVETAALVAVARQAEGGMRDALSLLDQLAAYAEPDQPIALADALAVLGAAPVDRFLSLARALGDADAGGALLQLDALLREGKDLRQFVRDFIGHLRDLLLLRVAEGQNILDLPTQMVDLLQDQARSLDRDWLMRAVETLAGLENDLRYSTNPRLLVEVALVRLCSAPSPVPAQAAPAPARAPSPRVTAAPAQTATFVPEPEAAAPAARAASPPPVMASPPAAPPAPASDELRRVREAWADVLQLFATTERAKPMQPFVRQAQPHLVNGRTLVLGFAPTPEGRTAHDRIAGKPVWVQRALVKVGLPEYQISCAFVADNPAPTAGAGQDLVSLLRERMGEDVPMEIKEEDD